MIFEYLFSLKWLKAKKSITSGHLAWSSSSYTILFNSHLLSVLCLGFLSLIWISWVEFLPDQSANRRRSWERWCKFSVVIRHCSLPVFSSMAVNQAVQLVLTALLENELTLTDILFKPAPYAVENGCLQSRTFLVSFIVSTSAQLTLSSWVNCKLHHSLCLQEATVS